jgi:outer membrane protein TolC
MVKLRKIFSFSLIISFFFALPSFGEIPRAAREKEKLNLAELVRLAQERNPGLFAIREQIKAEQSRIWPQATLPDPILSLNLKNISLNQFTIGKDMMSGVGFSFSQMIPFPGKLRLQREIAKTKTKRTEVWLEAYSLSLSRQIKELYSQLFYYQRALEVLNKKRSLLEKALELATIRYSVGGGVQNDVFKAQLELNEMETMIKPMEQMERALEGQINALLAFPLDKPLGWAEEIHFYELSPSLEDLIRAAEEKSPQLEEVRLMIEASSKEVDLSRRDFWPNFMIQGGKEFKGAFKDMYEIMIGIEIPLYFKRKQAKNLEAAVAELNQARYSFQARQNELNSMINENYLMAKNAEKLIRITRDKLLPQASLSLESSLANYKVGKVDFLALLADIDSLYSYEMEYYRQLSELWQAVSRLEELCGLDFLLMEGEGNAKKDNE